jgi:hypothetical protein
MRELVMLQKDWIEHLKATNGKLQESLQEALIGIRGSQEIQQRTLNMLITKVDSFEDNFVTQQKQLLAIENTINKTKGIVKKISKDPTSTNPRDTTDYYSRRHPACRPSPSHSIKSQELLVQAGEPKAPLIYQSHAFTPPASSPLPPRGGSFYHTPASAPTTKYSLTTADCEQEDSSQHIPEPSADSGNLHSFIASNPNAPGIPTQEYRSNLCIASSEEEDTAEADTAEDDSDTDEDATAPLPPVPPTTFPTFTSNLKPRAAPTPIYSPQGKGALAIADLAGYTEPSSPPHTKATPVTSTVQPGTSTLEATVDTSQEDPTVHIQSDSLYSSRNSIDNSTRKLSDDLRRQYLGPLSDEEDEGVDSPVPPCVPVPVTTTVESLATISQEQISYEHTVDLRYESDDSLVQTISADLHPRDSSKSDHKGLFIQPSSIHALKDLQDSSRGRGLFTSELIKKGQHVAYFHGHFISEDEYSSEKRKGRGGYGVKLKKGTILQCYDHAGLTGDVSCLASIVNSSWETGRLPNVRMVPCHTKKTLRYSAIKDIHPGEEILADYGDEYLWNSTQTSQTSSTQSYTQDSSYLPWGDIKLTDEMLTTPATTIAVDTFGPFRLIATSNITPSDISSNTNIQLEMVVERTTFQLFRVLVGTELETDQYDWYNTPRDGTCITVACMAAAELQLLGDTDLLQRPHTKADRARVTQTLEEGISTARRLNLQETVNQFHSHITSINKQIDHPNFNLESKDYLELESAMYLCPKAHKRGWGHLVKVQNCSDFQRVYQLKFLSSHGKEHAFSAHDLLDSEEEQQYSDLFLRSNHTYLSFLPGNYPTDKDLNTGIRSCLDSITSYIVSCQR